MNAGRPRGRPVFLFLKLWAIVGLSGWGAQLLDGSPVACKLLVAIDHCGVSGFVNAQREFPHTELPRVILRRAVEPDAVRRYSMLFEKTGLDFFP